MRWMLPCRFQRKGQIVKAKEMFDRFKNCSVRSGLDINRIEETLSRAPEVDPINKEPLSNAKRMQLLQFALFLADKTL